MGNARDSGCTVALTRQKPRRVGSATADFGSDAPDPGSAFRDSYYQGEEHDLHQFLRPSTVVMNQDCRPYNQRSSEMPPAGMDVTDIEWEPPEEENSPGEVTIGHTTKNDVNMPMTEVGARRLADRMFGDEKTELPLTGHGVHWVRSGFLAAPSTST